MRHHYIGDPPASDHYAVSPSGAGTHVLLQVHEHPHQARIKLTVKQAQHLIHLVHDAIAVVRAHAEPGRTGEDESVLEKRGIPDEVVRGLRRVVDRAQTPEHRRALAWLFEASAEEIAEAAMPGEGNKRSHCTWLLARAEEALGDRETAEKWVRKANRALGGQSPLEMVEAVEQVLSRIEDPTCA